MASIASLFLVLLLDVLLVGLVILALVPLAAFRKPAFAILKRNFISYFTTPTGYVFLFLFVLLASLGAFFPPEFFASNMATLDQLNFAMPAILLLYIPAITMSIWAEERRQGTDELLLTIPADDFDVVLGKYLAAATIFTASLLFAQLSTFSVLNYVALGGVDLGLFFTTFIGYWFMGMAMLAIGMVASFLTRNLTIAFILGVLFNAPLALIGYADWVISNADVAQSVARWGMASQFADFGRGVVSVSAVSYFSLLIALGIYLSMVLIGRRHWVGGKDGHGMFGHYMLRVLALVVLVLSATVFFTNHDYRYDATSERISSLSPDTYKLVRGLDTSRPIRVEAYISQSLPDSFIRTKYDLINLLKELRAMGGNIQVAINDKMEPFSEQAKQAEDRYGILPQTVVHEAQGAFKQEEIFLAAAVSSGAERVVIPFFGPGTPVEYELIRAIATVAPTKPTKSATTVAANEKAKPKAKRRKTVGIMRTDAQLTGGFNMQNFSQIAPQMIVDELKRQYEVEDLTPGDVVDKDKIDVLVVVQPSSLTEGQLASVLDAIRAGIPTAIFEDPAPVRFQGTVPGTDEPKRSPGGMFGMNQGPQPKCNIKELWDLLGVYMVKAKQGRRAQGDDAIRQDPAKGKYEVKIDWEPFTPVVWQHYNPYPKDRNIPDAAVFANPSAPGAKDVFNPSEPAVAGLREVLFMAPGAFEEAKVKSPEARGLTFTPIVQTGTDTGLQSLRDVEPPGLKEIKGQTDTEKSDSWIDIVAASRSKADPRLRTEDTYTLAAHITGKLNSAPSAKDDEQSKNKPDAESKDDTKSADKSEPKVNVMLVADIDLLESLFVRLRDQPMGAIDYQFQNVTFALNVIDALAGDERFINIRKRSRHHASLRLVEEQISKAEDEALESREKYEKDRQKSLDDAEAKDREIVQQLTAELVKAQQEGKLDSRKLRELEQKRDWKEKQNEERRQKNVEKHQRQLQGKLRQIQRDLDLERNAIQNTYKLFAITIPTIPLLLIVGAVFLYRWVRESEGVSPNRRR